MKMQYTFNISFITGHGTGEKETGREALTTVSTPQDALDYVAQWLRDKGFQEETIGWFAQQMEIETMQERPIRKTVEYKMIQYSGVSWIGLYIEQINEDYIEQNGSTEAPSVYVFSSF
jgi:hypothetical protein